MSNQRVVVLTDDEIHALVHRQAATKGRISALRKLKVALEHPEGITDDMVAAALAKGHEFAPEDDGFQAMRACLEAALFPGDGEQ